MRPLLLSPPTLTSLSLHEMRNDDLFDVFVHEHAFLCIFVSTAGITLLRWRKKIRDASR